MLSKAQVEDFVAGICRKYKVPAPRISRRLPAVHGPRRRQTLCLGREIRRDVLAQQLAEYLSWRMIAKEAREKKRFQVSSGDVRSWDRMCANLVTQHFGPGEGVSL